MITLNAVSIAYSGGRTGLHSTTLTFTAGEFIVILGPSGAGKSTLLRSLNGLVRPSSGSVSVDGLGILAGRTRVRQHRARTAMVFQQHHLIGRISALHNVLMGRLGHHASWRSLFPLPRRDYSLALESLAKVGLSDVALVRADTLSGGQQQRVGLARALAQQPRLILADEPVASLDPETAVRALGLLRDICKREGIAAVVSLHQVDLARRFADRIVGISGGRVVFDGAPDALDHFQLDRIYHPAAPSGETPADMPAGEIHRSPAFRSPARIGDVNA